MATKRTTVRSIARPRRVAILTYEDGQSLDVTGPFEVFASANRLWAHLNPHQPAPYELQIVAPRRGPIAMTSGIRLVADLAYGEIKGRLDTLIVAGGEVDAVLADQRLREWLRHIHKRSRRLASVCTGAFLLAEAGLLNGHRATTHWAAAGRLAARYPEIDVERDAIFVCSQGIYTSAGVTAGIDLALALVEADLGHQVAVTVARHLVVFLKRPGGQSQFSSHLAAQRRAPGALGDLPEWILGNLTGDLTVESLSARAAMSPRNFARVFAREMRTTPAKFVERARLDAARRALEDSAASLDEVAARVGFASSEQMRRSFRRNLKVQPQEYRRRFHNRAA